VSTIKNPDFIVQGVCNEDDKKNDFHVLSVLCLPLRLNSMAWVRERTITTERPHLVGDVDACLLQELKFQLQFSGYLSGRNWGTPTVLT
jgi:hypothetical protein